MFAFPDRVLAACPVALVVVTTVLGAAPLLRDSFLRSLAVVIICGLNFATVLTLIVVPTLDAIFFRVETPGVPAEDTAEASA